MKIPRPQFSTPWTTDINPTLRAIEHEFSKVHARLDKLEEFVRYVDEVAPELRTAYEVKKRIE